MKSKLKCIHLDIIAVVAKCLILNSRGQQHAVTRVSGEIKETDDRVCTLSLAHSPKPKTSPACVKHMGFLFGPGFDSPRFEPVITWLARGSN